MSRRHELMPGFACSSSSVPTYYLESIYPLRDAPIAIFQEMARHIPDITEVASTSDRYRLRVEISYRSYSEKGLGIMVLFAEEVRRYFEPITVGHPHLDMNNPCPNPSVPGFLVTLTSAGENNQCWRDKYGPGDPIKRATIICPTRTTYVGKARLEAIAATVPGIDDIRGCGYDKPNYLTVEIATFYQDKARQVISMLLTQLRRVFPTEGTLPLHSPLHHEALTLNDLEVGATITRYCYGRSVPIETATVTGIVGDEGKNVTVLILGNERHVLAPDLGLSTYANVEGAPTHWHAEHYCLLASDTTN